MALTQDPEEVAKTCARCRLGKSAAEFYRYVRSKDGLNSYCKECHRADGKLRNLVYGKTEYRIQHRRNAKLMSQYGITLDQFKSMWQEQRGLCANTSCSQPATHVDHDHQTGQVRKILCNGCNVSLGWLHENPDRIRGLAKYAEAC